jgi:hypothetical protein
VGAGKTLRLKTPTNLRQNGKFPNQPISPVTFPLLFRLKPLAGALGIGHQPSNTVWEKSMFAWFVGIALVVVIVALAIALGVYVARRPDEKRLTMLVAAFWLFLLFIVGIAITEIVFLATGHEFRPLLVALFPIATLSCIPVTLRLSIIALKNKIEFKQLPDPDEQEQLEFKTIKQRCARIGARVMLLFALLQFENGALNYVTQSKTDADRAYKTFLIDSRQDAIKHSLTKIQIAINTKSNSPLAIQHALDDVNQSLADLKQFARR